MTDLRQLLQDAVPEPPLRLDPRSVVTAARHRHRTRVTATVLVAAAVALVAVVASALPVPWRHRAITDPAAVPLHLSALEHRRPLDDYGREAAADLTLVHPGQGTRFGSVDGKELWLVETTDGSLCFLVATEAFCGGRDQLLDTGVITGIHPGLGLGAATGSGPVHVVVAAPDGYTTASAAGVSADISDNVAVLAFPQPPYEGRLTLEGDGLPTVTFSLIGRVGLPADPVRARRLQAQAALESLAGAARIFARSHGSTAGFAASLPADERGRLQRSKITVTDTTADTRSGSTCLHADLRTGEVTTHPC